MSADTKMKTEHTPQLMILNPETVGVPAKPPTMAARSHKYICYEAALQPRPGDDVAFYLDKYQRRSEFIDLPQEDTEHPVVLREDFSGSGMVSIEWLKSEPRRLAWAVDNDPEVFEWCRSRHFPKIDPTVRERLVLLEENVLNLSQMDIQPADVVCANNFSWQCFKEESSLERYFQGVFTALKVGGIFVLDIFGGQDTLHESHELISDHDVTLSDGEPGEFSYVYEQLKVDPLTRHMDIGVSFDFTDGSSLQHAFYYQWRVWEYRAVREKLVGVGFRAVHLFKDWSDEDGHYRHGHDPLSVEEWEAIVRDDNYQSAYVVAYK